MKRISFSVLLIIVGLALTIWLVAPVFQRPSAEEWRPEYTTAWPSPTIPKIQPRESRPAAPAPATSPDTVDTPVDGATADIPVARAEAVDATPSSTPPLDIDVQADVVKTMIRDFRLKNNGNPVGTNKEITAALRGGNAAGTDYLAGQPVQLSQEGELLDPWGKPYFFHQVSADEMELRSAGPDRQMWNEDDRVW